MATPVAQVQGLCDTFTWNQQDDFLTPAGDVETSTAAFPSKFQLAGEGRCPQRTAPRSPPAVPTLRATFSRRQPVPSCMAQPSRQPDGGTPPVHTCKMGSVPALPFSGAMGKAGSLLW